MPHQFEIFIIQQVSDISSTTGEEIVQTITALLDKAFTQMTSEKAAPPVTSVA